MEKKIYDGAPEFEEKYQGMQIKWHEYNEKESFSIDEIIKKSKDSSSVDMIVDAICHDHGKKHTYEYKVTAEYNKKEKLILVRFATKPKLPPTWEYPDKWTFAPGVIEIELDEQSCPTQITWVDNTGGKYILEKNDEWYFYKNEN